MQIIDNPFSKRFNIHSNQKIIFDGPQGLIQGAAFNLKKTESANLALILSPDPSHKGTMNHPVVNLLFNSFKSLGFSVLKFNYRGIGESKGNFINKENAIEDALFSLDWLISQCESTEVKDPKIFITGFSLGGWIALQCAMRRPEVSNFITINSQFYSSDFNMLTPCPNGLMIQSTNDRLYDYNESKDFANHLIKQKGCSIVHQSLEDNHYLTNSQKDASEIITNYIKNYKINTQIKNIKRY